MPRATSGSKRRHPLATALLVLTLPLIMGQIEDCLPDPDPKSNARPLAIDCVADGTQIYIPIEMTVAPDRQMVALAGGAFVDTTVTARIPAAMFCAVANASATQTDLHGGILAINISNTREQGDSFALHSPVNLPIQNIVLADACAGAYGPEILVDFGTVQTVPWPGEDWTINFEIAPPPLSLQILLKNIDLPGWPVPGPTLDLLTFCEPTDKSDPPNGTTYDPEDSPRLAADRDFDGVYESLATADDQVKFNVQGYCVGHRCEDFNDCTIDLCNRLANGWCTWENQPDGTACDLGGAPGVCSAGTCVQYTGPPCDVSAPECTKAITLGCTNNVTADVSILPVELTVTPDPVIGGSTVAVNYDGAWEFPEVYLDGAQPLAPGGVTIVDVVDLQATVHVRSGATGADVTLIPEPIPYACTLDTGVSCDPANDQPSIPGLRPNTDCVPTGTFNPCGRFVSVPTSIDCGPGGLCETLGLDKFSQCAANGFCVTGPLSIPLEDVDTSINTDVSGAVLFGWDDQSTGATVNPDGTWSLPFSLYTDPLGPNGLKVVQAGLAVSLECTMGVASDGPLGTLPPVPDQASPTPDSALIDFAILSP